MKGKVLIVTLLSIIGILIFWLPLPRVGDYIIGGYPWNSPENARTPMIILGVIVTGIFVFAIVAINILSRKIEEVGDETVYPMDNTRDEGEAQSTEDW
jgi:hypothetical protein